MIKELRKFNNFEEIAEFVSLPLTENVPYIANWQVTYAELLDFLAASLQVVDDVVKNYGTPVEMFTRYHAVAMKERANKYDMKCGYVEVVFSNTISGKIVYICGVNAFPIEGQGIVYFSPALMMFIPELVKGTDFGEVRIKECKIIW